MVVVNKYQRTVQTPPHTLHIIFSETHCAYFYINRASQHIPQVEDQQVDSSITERTYIRTYIPSCNTLLWRLRVSSTLDFPFGDGNMNCLPVVCRLTLNHSPR